MKNIYSEGPANSSTRDTTLSRPEKKQYKDWAVWAPKAASLPQTRTELCGSEDLMTPFPWLKTTTARSLSCPSDSQYKQPQCGGQYSTPQATDDFW